MATRHQNGGSSRTSRMQLFELVADVARYPEFLPWCFAGRIRRAKSPTVEIAELAIGFGLFHEKFVSRVVRAPDDPEGPRIDTTGIEGPVPAAQEPLDLPPASRGHADRLRTRVRFPLAAAAEDVRLLFAEAVRRMVSAFEARAAQLLREAGA